MKNSILPQSTHFNNPNSINFVEKVDRNESLYKDFKKGMDMFAMCAKYRITSTRIYAILKKMKKQEIKEDKKRG